MSGVIIGFTAGIYVALNSLGAGGGQPDSANMVETVNATLCSVAIVSSAFGGTILNKLGHAITMFIGVLSYMIYVGGLWFFDRHDGLAFPLVGGVLLGIGAGCVYVVVGHILLSYPEEKEKGLYATISLNGQAAGSVIGSIIPVILNRDAQTSAGVPTAVYAVFEAMMGVAAIMSLFLLPPDKLTRDDGSKVAVAMPRTAKQEFVANLRAFKDWKLLLLFPGCFAAEAFLVYVGSMNAFSNNLRTRSLLSFIAVVLQIPFGFLITWILDNKRMNRRTRTLVGLTFVAVPLYAAWIWQIVRVRNWNRNDPPTYDKLVDWSDSDFVSAFFLFMLTWVASNLWQYIMMYFLGAITNDPVRLAHYAGIYRGFLAAGEALLFGLDSIGIPYIKEAGGIFAFYGSGCLICFWLGWYHIEDTMYFKEDHVVVPNHIIHEIVDNSHELPVPVDEQGMVVLGIEPTAHNPEKGQDEKMAVTSVQGDNEAGLE
ncbi:hypothetical protein A1O1_08646 [Capronia coronata CBS 617.96]|uniref:Major facilitator superfamily (MFS) profile domain-containing protein n=1 Tax=Capronia coronata CBS 617.96 TaxID=1182541 RepID=W9XU36_9EURO|nr:uncharacterized protein A1O1_08646 [Capronia coronata CBS 617.96]EXJ80501.1 hypothetical protein A1O1_08646 [Capronia coronata CBS 617.96]